MSFINTSLLLGSVLCASCFGSGTSLLPGYPTITSPPYYWGVATNGLQPLLEIERGDKDWSCEIFYLAQTNFDANAWLKITNRVGSKIKLVETNGAEFPLQDKSAAIAWTIPVDTTVSEVMNGVDRPRRTLQWWRTGLTNSVAGKLYSATTFRLESLYGKPFTNECVLSLSPLLYKVEKNGESAHLIEFPTIRVGLKPNGRVEKLQ